MANYEFIGKGVFFPEGGVLAIGDLHLGYEHMMKQLGVNLPETQTKEIIQDLKKIFSEIENKGHKVKKIIFLGDIKHYFGYERGERTHFDEVLQFLKGHFEEKDIILIKGNHDAVQYSGKKMRDYYIDGNTAFLHGHKSFVEIYDTKIKVIVIGHLHPAIIISDKKGVKKEKFKCFLAGKMEGKELIVLPSFFDIVGGMNINDYKEVYHDFVSIVPKKTLINSEVFVIGENETYNFGKVKDLD